MRKTLWRLAILAIGLIRFNSVEASPSPAMRAITPRPKLVVVIVFDQFRADYLTRFESRFLPARKAGGEIGGFKYLMEEGSYYPLAQYGVLQNMTCVGHAMILSGAYPYRSGIALNGWIDPVTAKPRYCVDDPTDGRSPRNMLGTTIGDELKNAGYPSRVVAVALKDRAAILLGGHRADLALWFDAKAFTWGSSRYYVKTDLPDWVKKLNAGLSGQRAGKAGWKSEGSGTGYSANETFAHEATDGDALDGPTGTDLTVSAAESAVDALSLGRGKATDLLAVSFSSHDLIGHTFGPNSREMEELTVYEDRGLAHLLNHLKRRMGSLKDVIFALTADHGAPPLVEYMKENRISAGRVDLKALRQNMNARVTDVAGKTATADWIAGTYELNVFFDAKALGDRRQDAAQMEKLEAAVKKAGLGMPEVVQAFTHSDYEAGKLPPGIYRRLIERSYYPGRSGDVVLIPKPFYYPGEHTGIDHMSLYNYDSTVPLLLAGPGIRKGRRPESAEIADLAPTLAYLLGTLPPAMSEGRVLSEALTDSTRK